MNKYEGNRIFRRPAEEQVTREIDSARTLDELIERSAPQVQQFVMNNPQIVEVFLSQDFHNRLLSKEGKDQVVIARNLAVNESHLFKQLDLEGDALIAFIIALARQVKQ